MVPGAAELPCACSPSRFYAFPSWVLYLKPLSCSCPSVQQSFPSLYFPPCLSPASPTALQCHSSEQPGMGQCHGDRPEQGARGESPQRTLQGSAHSGIREREGYKSVYKKMSVLQMKSRCPVERCLSRSAAVLPLWLCEQFLLSFVS